LRRLRRACSFSPTKVAGARRSSADSTFSNAVDADNGVEAAVDLAGDHRHQATRGARVKLRRASPDDELTRRRAKARRPSQAMTRPGNTAPTMGPGTPAIVIEPWRMA
jgi:hypothetical protein